MEIDYVLFQKLILSLILGAAVGLERELKKKPLGLKTTIIISVSSCLLTIVSIHASDLYAVAYEKPMDL
ncbi:MgtC/SapB family protein [Bacillus sp. DJP31]|uniref:MgtC/SapB family protein n=1 Tax=Bacillus sp. DJP31 TaxID=3409789 RepID=UPI003BB66CFC